MRKIFMIHGSYGDPENCWFPWLKKELEKLGCKVIVPRFPTPKGQILSQWIKTFEEYIPDLDENSIMIGHSLGTPFILNILQRLNHPIKASFFVGGFIGLVGNTKFDPIIKSFSDRKFNWKRIKQNCSSFTVIHSDNDPYVPLPKGQELAKLLGVELTLIPGGMHFNTAAGWLKFNQLLDKIKPLL